MNPIDWSNPYTSKKKDRIPMAHTRLCAVCGKRIKNRDICNECFKKWGNNGNYPEWLKEMINMQRSFDLRMTSDEIPFSDIDLDENGELEEED